MHVTSAACYILNSAGKMIQKVSVFSFASSFIYFLVLCVFLIDFCVCTQTEDEIVKYLERYKNVNKMGTSIGAEGVRHPA